VTFFEYPAGTGTILGIHSPVEGHSWGSGSDAQLESVAEETTTNNNEQYWLS